MRKVEKMLVTGKRLPGRPKGTWEQLVQRDMKKEGLKKEQATGSKKLEKVDQRSTNSREGKGLQAKMMIMKLTFMSTWVCMQACVGIHIRRGFIVSPIHVKGIIRTLNENDDDGDDDD